MIVVWYSASKLIWYTSSERLTQMKGEQREKKQLLPFLTNSTLPFSVPLAQIPTPMRPDKHIKLIVLPSNHKIITMLQCYLSSGFTKAFAMMNVRCGPSKEYLHYKRKFLGTVKRP